MWLNCYLVVYKNSLAYRSPPIKISLTPACAVPLHDRVFIFLLINHTTKGAVMKKNSASSPGTGAITQIAIGQAITGKHLVIGEGMVSNPPVDQPSGF